MSIDGVRIVEDLTDPVPVMPGQHTVTAVSGGIAKTVSVEAEAGVVVDARLVDVAPAPVAATSRAGGMAPRPRSRVRRPPLGDGGPASTSGWRSRAASPRYW